MMPIRSVIVDDEAPGRAALRSMLSIHQQEIVVVGEAASVEEARAVVTKTNPQVIFLDISMPGGLGIELPRLLERNKFIYVFVTAHSDYAIRAIREGALDYLLKPVSSEDLSACLERLKSRLHTVPEEGYKDRIEHLFELLHQHKMPQKKIQISSAHGFNLINPADILFLQADNNYTQFYLINGQQHLASSTMGNFEAELPPDQFFRIHKSTIINLSHFVEFSRVDGNFAVMSNGAKLPVSKRKTEEFLSLFKK
jgi:two-component system LytT family response regulator